MKPLFLSFLASIFVLGPPLQAFAAKKRRAVVVGRKAVNRTSRSTIGEDGIKLRKTRRVAVGGSVGGALGFAGANLELNISPTTGFIGGYGGGPGYTSFSIQMRNYLAGDSFLPFIGAGYARWFNSNPNSGEITSSKPGFLVEKFLNDEEKRTGVFAKNLVYPSVGAQYVNLEGEWAGFSLTVEVMMLVDVGSLQAAPTGSVGMGFYF